MPAGSQFAIASRDVLPLPTARLRAQGRIVEVGADDLAMGEAEAACAVKRGRASSCGGDEVHDLVERTEGWPAGLYLAALAINAGSPRAEAVFSFTGDDRYMGDYLRSEILDRVSRAEVSFLTRTSILDRLCGPLCDAALDTQGSGGVLDQIDSHNLLVVPLDRRRYWYRYHQLFRQLLHAELNRREPEVIPALHPRAAAWYEANGGRRQPSNTHRPPATPSGSPDSCSTGINPCGPAAASRPSSAGWSGSRTRPASSTTRPSPSTAP